MTKWNDLPFATPALAGTVLYQPTSGPTGRFAYGSEYVDYGNGHTYRQVSSSAGSSWQLWSEIRPEGVVVGGPNVNPSSLAGVVYIATLNNAGGGAFRYPHHQSRHDSTRGRTVPASCGSTTPVHGKGRRQHDVDLEAGKVPLDDPLV